MVKRHLFLTYLCEMMREFRGEISVRYSFRTALPLDKVCLIQTLSMLWGGSVSDLGVGLMMFSLFLVLLFLMAS